MKGRPSKDCNIDLGLAILSAMTSPPHTHHTIACYCGCSWQRIWQIEQRALRKCRAALYRDKVLARELSPTYGKGQS
jgi:DNA-directed RNA polymerase sigma subunit (sigma70/sigma32)